MDRKEVLTSWAKIPSKSYSEMAITTMLSRI